MVFLAETWRALPLLLSDAFEFCRELLQSLQARVLPLGDFLVLEANVFFCLHQCASSQLLAVAVGLWLQVARGARRVAMLFVSIRPLWQVQTIIGEARVLTLLMHDGGVAKAQTVLVVAMVPVQRR